MSDFPNIRLSDCSIFRISEFPIFRFSDFPTFRFSKSPVFQISEFPIINTSDFPIFRFSYFWFSDFLIFHFPIFRILKFLNFGMTDFTNSKQAKKKSYVVFVKFANQWLKNRIHQNRSKNKGIPFTFFCENFPKCAKFFDKIKNLYFFSFFHQGYLKTSFVGTRNN